MLRLPSLLIGLLLILVTWRIGVTLLPADPIAPLLAAAFVALVPQHTAMMASINNDCLAELLMALALLLALREGLQLSTGPWERILLGSVVGLALLTKLTVAIAYPVSACALLLQLRQSYAMASPQERDGFLRRHRLDLALVLVLPLVLIAPWCLRNAAVYGWPDFLGLIRHESVVLGQPRTMDWIIDHGLQAWLVRLFTFTFQSFWGQFGWMAVPMQPGIYAALMAGCLLAAAGLARCLLSGSGKPANAVCVNIPRQGWILLLTTMLLSVLVFLWYNLHFVQHQGRYLYSALVPLAILAAVGWRTVWIRLDRCFPGGSLLVFCGLLVLLNLHALFRVVGRHAW